MVLVGLSVYWLEYKGQIIIISVLTPQQFNRLVATFRRNFLPPSSG
jgi:hypothetical protein